MTVRPESDLPASVRRLVDAGRLRLQPMPQAQVVALWRKAVESARDAALPGMSVDGSLRAAAAAFGHAGLEDLVPVSLQVRGFRKGSMYDPVLAGPPERDETLAWMRRTLPAVRVALATVDPEVAPLLEAPP